MTKNYEYKVGGSLEENAPSYVVRQADSDLYHGLKAGEFCYIFNSRQMGKTSLIVRTMNKLRAEGFACTSLDFSVRGSRDIKSEQWYAGIVYKLITNFKLGNPSEFLRGWWQERDAITPVERLEEFIETVLLTSIQSKIIIFIDEIDSILSLNFTTDDFFALIRSCYEKRNLNLEYKRLAFALVGVATPGDLISDKRRTPFNIGRAIQLDGFKDSEIEPLAKGFKSKIENPLALMREVLAWTGGQPFLTQKVCKLIQQETEALPAIIKSQIIENWEAQDEPEHLKTIRDRLLIKENRAARLLGLYQQILQQYSVPVDDSPEQMELRLSGLVVKQQNCLKIYNRIYEAIFNQFWVEQRLAQLRPYSEQLKAWLDSGCQDKSRLLRGLALQDALIWADSKSLTDKDYKFLNASQEELNKLRKHQQKVTWLWAATMTTAVAGILGWLFWLNKIPYILHSDRFSQGERSFFLSDVNSAVLNGIKAFKQKNFSEAEAFFQIASDANLNDPELMIYKNNAKAWAKGNPITLAVAIPLDKQKTTATMILYGVALAQEEFNSNQKANRLLNIILAKDNNEPMQVKEVAQELIKDKNVLAVIGHDTSSSTKSVLGKYQKAPLAIISATSSSIELSGNGFFRTVVSDRVIGKRLVDYAIKDKIKRVAIFYQDNPHGRSVRDEFKKEFEKQGGRIVREPIDVMKLKPDYPGIVKQIVLKDQADAVLFCTNADVYDVVLKIVQARNNIPNFSKRLKILSGNGLYRDISLRQPFEGLILAPPWFEKEDTGQEKEFTLKAKKRWRGYIHWETATSYDATKAFLKAISMSANPTRETVLSKLKSVKLEPHETSGSELNFSEGERKQKLLIVKVVKSKNCPQGEKLCYKHEIVNNK